MNISVRTAQNVDIEYAPAGLLDRILATLIDYCAIAGISFPLVYLAIVLSESLGDLWYIYVAFLPLLFYHLVCEAAFNGQSLGKKALRLQVARLDGRRLSFWHCLLRWAFRLVDISIAGGAVAVISIICTRRSQRLGDMAAGTTVIRRVRASASALSDPYEAPDDYEVVFPQAALLSDSDLRVIREVLAETKRRADYSLLPPLATRVKTITGISTDLPNLQFLETLLRDASHLARQ